MRQVLTVRQFEAHIRLWDGFLVRLGAIKSTSGPINLNKVATNFVKLDDDDKIQMDPVKAERLKRFVAPSLKDKVGKLKLPLKASDVRKAFYLCYAKYLDAKMTIPPKDLLEDEAMEYELKSEFVIFMQWATARPIGPKETVELGKFRSLVIRCLRCLK